MPDKQAKTSLPIRAFEEPRIPAGKEPLTSTPAHILGLDFLSLIADVNCSRGAEEPNVKDEPRRGLARAVPFVKSWIRNSNQHSS